MPGRVVDRSTTETYRTGRNRPAGWGIMKPSSADSGKSWDLCRSSGPWCCGFSRSSGICSRWSCSLRQVTPCWPTCCAACRQATRARRNSRRQDTKRCAAEFRPVVRWSSTRWYRLLANRRAAARSGPPGAAPASCLPTVGNRGRPLWPMMPMPAQRTEVHARQRRLRPERTKGVTMTRPRGHARRGRHGLEVAEVAARQRRWRLQ